MIRKKLFVIVVVCLIMLGSLLIFVPDEGEAVIVPYVEIRMNPSTVTLDVAPGGNPTAQVNCIINNPTIHQETIRVTIAGPGLSITPQVFMVTVGSFQEITVPIAVAAEPRSARRFVSVTVHGVLEKADGCPPPEPYETYSGFQVIITQYARAVMTVSEPFQKVKPGKEYPINLRIINNGNDRDSFEILCTTKEELEDEGFSIVIVPAVTTDVDSQKYTEVKVVVQTPKNLWENDYHSLEFEAISKLQGSNEKVPMSMTLWVWGMYVPSFDPVFVLITAAVVAAGLGKRFKAGDEEDEEWW